jgi:hypothetical protein
LNWTINRRTKEDWAKLYMIISECEILNESSCSDTDVEPFDGMFHEMDYKVGFREYSLKEVCVKDNICRVRMIEDYKKSGRRE